jgi:general secretion pathway protein D
MIKKHALHLLITTFAVVFFLVGLSSAQEQQQKTVIQTPFGPKEIDVPPAPAPQPAPQIQAAPAATAPTPATPAAAQPAPQPQQPPAPAPAPAPAAAGGQGDEIATISLHLDNTDIYQVIKIICDYLGLNYIIDPTVRGTVNINTSGTLRRSDLLPILETLLKLNGATMIRVNNFYQIVPTTAAARQPLPVQDQISQVAPDDQMTLQIIRMKFVAAAEMARLLMPYLSEGASINSHEAGNILLVSERRSNLRKLLDIIDIFDNKVFEGDRVRLLPVKNSLVTQVIDDLKAVFAGYGFSETGGGAIKFLPLQRMNSILVITGNPAIFDEVQNWLDRLDQPTNNAGLRNYVYKMKNAKATDVQGVLANLYGVPGQRSVPTVTANPAGAPPAAPGAAPGPPATPFTAPQPGASAPTNGFAGDVKIIADQVTNSLIVQTTPQQWAEIERTLAQLDVLARQVLIDAQIYEVTLDDSLSLGISAFLQNRITPNPQTTASFAGAPPVLAAQTFALVGRTRELLLFLNASENRSRVRTLSAPSVLVSDNMAADFQVGAEIPVPTSSSITPVTSGGTNLFAQTISFRPTGVLLRVKPQINDSGTVTLELSQEVSQASANTTSAVVAPVIGKTSVNSTIVVHDAQTIAISGFIRESRELARARIPLLGRIPIAGNLFGNTRNATTRNELIVLITPHVMRTREDADASTEELKSKLKEVQKLIN